MTSKIFLIITTIIFLTNCSSDIRQVSDNETLKENEGILLFIVNHINAPMLRDWRMDIIGFDINDPEKKQIGKIWTYNKSATKRVYSFIVPAGRYRIESINSVSDDQTILHYNAETAELEYHPRFSFYVTKGKINYLGVLTLTYTENDTVRGTFPMQHPTNNRSSLYIFGQKNDIDYLSDFISKYKRLFKQTSGSVYQEISFKPWNRTFEASDPLKQSPTFEIGYNKVKWQEILADTRSILQNLYVDNARLEVVSNFRLVDSSKKGEISVFDFNHIKGIQYPNGGLFKVTTIQSGNYEETLKKMKLLYGYYNTEGNKVTWRMVHTMLTLEKLDDNFVRITRVSMEYVRKVATLKPGEIGTIQPTETTLRPAIIETPASSAAPQEQAAQPSQPTETPRSGQ